MNDFDGLADAWNDMLHFDGWEDVDPDKYLASGPAAAPPASVPSSTASREPSSQTSLSLSTDPWATGPWSADPTSSQASDVDPSQQTWSEYMGTSQDDDNPWSNLDAFADSPTVVTPFPPRPGQPTSPGAAPAAATDPQPEDSPETLAMKAMIAQMVARQPAPALASAPPPTRTTPSTAPSTSSNNGAWDTPSISSTHPGQQTWSDYMGTSQDDDNPWSNLDVFADSPVVAAPLPSPARPGEAPAASVAQPSSATAPQLGDDPETLAMKAVVARMVGCQPGSATARPAPTASTGTETAPHAPWPSALPQLTHVAPPGPREGGVNMVDVSSKPATQRSATAQGRVWLPSAAVAAVQAAEQGRGPLTKGPVFHTAQLAGIMGAKRTSELVPLCHPLALSQVEVDLGWDEPEDGGCYVVVRCTARTTGPTGVEMEALAGASTACLTVWDMTKAVAGTEMVIDDLKVVAKSGGRGGDWSRSDA